MDLICKKMALLAANNMTILIVTICTIKSMPDIIDTSYAMILLISKIAPILFVFSLLNDFISLNHEYVHITWCDL